MPRAATSAETAPNVQELFPIRTVASLTGVNAVTLRAWERRYGLIRPVRTKSGHRLYRREEIDLIHRVLGLLSTGMAIGQVLRSLGALPRRARAASERSRTWWEERQLKMIAAVSRFDEGSLEDSYNEALALHPIAEVTQKLLLPLLSELGRRWESREGSVAEEHFFATYLRNKLGARFHHRPRGNGGPRILTACLPGEHHEIGLMLFALSLHEMGMQPVLLGANVPLDDLALAARRGQCAAIVLSGSIDPAPAVLDADLRALVSATPLPVFIGGLTSVRERDAIVAAGAVPLGTDVSAAAERIRAAAAK